MLKRLGSFLCFFVCSSSFYAVLRGCSGAGAVRTQRSVAERVVWERRAPATAHGAPIQSFLYIRAHISV